jgi:hypothetical protein
MLLNINCFLNDIMLYVKVREPLQIYKHVASYFEKNADANGGDISVLAGDPGAGVGGATPYHQIVNKPLKFKNKIIDFSNLPNIKHILFFINSCISIRNNT